MVPASRKTRRARSSLEEPSEEEEGEVMITPCMAEVLGNVTKDRENGNIYELRLRERRSESF
jgi:hypothetical protein